jgi:nicotine blue oxidoreductase
MGTPKALIRDPDGLAWVVRASRLLTAAGCSLVAAVVGAAAQTVRTELTGEPVRVIEAADWSEGMGASLRAGLTSVSGWNEPVEAVVVVPVDLPGLTVAAVRRVLEQASADALVRATYQGAPGHPVLIGSAHWPGVIASAHGDEGARRYLRGHRAELVECADLAGGDDVDTPQDLPPGHHA